MIKAEEMVKKICPILKQVCIGPECVNWMGKDVIIEAHSGVWTEGVSISRGYAKCRLWNDSQDFGMIHRSIYVEIDNMGN